jgi:peptide/nickel transport system permease protein
LDKPAIERYFIWLGAVLTGDMGVSTSTNESVWSMVSARIGPTLLLTGTSLLLSLIIAIPLGIMASIKPYSAWDNVSSFLSFIGASTPNFFVALVLVYFFSAKLGWLPSMGMHTNTQTGLLDLVRHMILPCFVMVIHMIGTFIKQTRGSMMEVIKEEYVKTARSKGISEVKVVIKHIFRNACIPIVSCVGLNVPFLIGGSTVTEQVFGWPGIGSLLVLSISRRDYNVIMGITIVIAVVVLLASLLVDLIYAYLDPRIRFK